MFPPFVGLLMLLGSLGLAGLGLVTLVIGMVQGRPPLARIGGQMTAASGVGYGLLWLVGLLGSPHRSLAVGQEVSFCGLDCHLHVSVVRSERRGDLGVVVRFRSNARAAAEYPGLLRLEVVDSSGHRYQPSDGMIAEPLDAGATIEREFRFTVPPEARGPTLVVSYNGLMDYLVPGRANPIAQRRIRLALDQI